MNCVERSADILDNANCLIQAELDMQLIVMRNINNTLNQKNDVTNCHDCGEGIPLARKK
jgi:RNA polymerase-binding transcription factor DksA